MIFKYMLFFALLLPTIMSLQVYLFFGIFDLRLLIIPTAIGLLVGYLLAHYRQEIRHHIKNLTDIKEGLKEEVARKTKELEEKNAILEARSLIDSLTGLGNRVKLKKAFKKDCQRLGIEYEDFSVIMIDIDYFKEYNDNYGHLKGDDVLSTIGAAINTLVKETAITAVRFGGEEFCLLLPGYTKASALEVAQALQQTIHDLQIPHHYSSVSDIITISIGVHTTTEPQSHESCTLIEDADKALYQAKDGGRNTIACL